MIDHDVARRYTYLKGHALQLAKAFDLSEASYQRLFDDGLIPLDEFLTDVHGRVVTPDLERTFARAARETCFARKRTPDRYPTIDSILDLAIGQRGRRRRRGPRRRTGRKTRRATSRLRPRTMRMPRPARTT